MVLAQTAIEFGCGGGFYGTTAAVTEDARSRAAPPLTTRERERLSAAMERYAGGDAAAFGELYEGLAPRLHGFLLRQTRSAARADDVLQQTFLKMHAARGRFIAGADVVPWAFAIARRLVIDGARRGRREVLAEGTDEADPWAEVASVDARADELVEAQAVADAIRRELATLPEAQRVAFELVKQEGLSVAEAAEVLGTTVAAVKLRAHRAYVSLRAALGYEKKEGGEA